MNLNDAERSELSMHLQLAIADRTLPDAREDKRCREWIERLTSPWYDVTADNLDRRLAEHHCAGCDGHDIQAAEQAAAFTATVANLPTP